MTEYLYKSQLKEINSKKCLNIDQQRLNELDDALVNCIIKDARPFGDFQKDGMKDFLNVALPGYSGPSRFTVKRKVGKKYKDFKKKLVNFLKEIPDVAITTDMWKNKRLTHFLCLTAHYFDKDFNYCSLIVSFRKFIGRHQSSSLRKFIQKELTKLGIFEKVRGITTDNGSDIKKAGKELFDRFSCLCHNLNLIVQSIFNQK